MAGRRKPSTDPREESIEELEWFRLTLTTIGGLYGEVVDSQSWNAFGFLDGVLADGSSPNDWIRSGVATWIESLQASAGLVRGICSTLSKPVGPLGPQSGVYGDQIEFFVDRRTQATDPIPTKIPLDQINSVRIADGDGLPAECVNLTASAEGIVYVALEGLDKQNLRKKRYDVQLRWGMGAKTTFIVHVA
jgi:hypothetical protein